MLRDDTIAYWEAWKRAVGTEACMGEAGFLWNLEVGYPQEVIVQITESLGVSVVHGPATALSAEEVNADLYSQLSEQEQDAYAQALYGESAADLQEFNETGAVPEGRDDSFAAGGCLGASWSEVGSIWDLGRTVGPEILELELTLKETQFDEVRADYGDCAAGVGLDGIDGPEDLDQMLLDATEVENPAPPEELDALLALTDEVNVACDSIWATGSREAYAHALSVVRDRHPELFDAQIERYEDALDEITLDKEFLMFLATEAGRA